MEELIIELENPNDNKNNCIKYIIITIIIDLLSVTWIWTIIRFIYIFFIISLKNKLDEKCYKKLLIIVLIPAMLLLLVFGWCLIMIAGYSLNI